MWAALWARRPARPLPACLPRARGPRSGQARQPCPRCVPQSPRPSGPLWAPKAPLGRRFLCRYLALLRANCQGGPRGSQGRACAPFLHGLISQRQIHCSSECFFNWRGSPESGKNLTPAEPDHGANQRSPVPAPRGKKAPRNITRWRSFYFPGLQGGKVTQAHTSVNQLKRVEVVRPPQLPCLITTDMNEALYGLSFCQKLFCVHE
uniref:Uncharacterized protein LOC112829796 n=1 Tax=Callorhinus ursinus TaxID=34884 RepID=A0A3Q7R4E8_CALUR|nr:uncharacterized protein LOC112829796 [Callorhinus ursinus]